MRILIPLTLCFLFVPLKFAAAKSNCAGGKTYPVTLTFDDGPNSTLTPKVLEILKKHKVKATFFVLGDQFSDKEKFKILKQMREEGHVVGSHTFHHTPHSSKIDPVTKKRVIVPLDEAKEDIEHATAVLKDYLSPVLRLPYGDGSFRSKDPEVQKENEKVMKMIKDLGYRHVGWNIDTNDWDPKKRDLIPKILTSDPSLGSEVDTICNKRGGIILFHDVQASTVAHLDEWLTLVEKQGHPMLPLEHFVPEAGKMYKRSHGDLRSDEACVEPLKNQLPVKFMEELLPELQDLDL